jgi:hypothetical protein
MARVPTSEPDMNRAVRILLPTAIVRGAHGSTATLAMADPVPGRSTLAAAKISAAEAAGHIRWRSAVLEAEHFMAIVLPIVNSARTPFIVMASEAVLATQARIGQAGITVVVPISKVGNDGMERAGGTKGVMASDVVPGTTLRTALASTITITTTKAIDPVTMIRPAMAN